MGFPECRWPLRDGGRGDTRPHPTCPGPQRSPRERQPITRQNAFPAKPIFNASAGDEMGHNTVGVFGRANGPPRSRASGNMVSDGRDLSNLPAHSHRPQVRIDLLRHATGMRRLRPCICAAAAESGVCGGGYLVAALAVVNKRRSCSRAFAQDAGEVASKGMDSCAASRSGSRPTVGRSPVLTNGIAHRPRGSNGEAPHPLRRERPSARTGARGRRSGARPVVPLKNLLA